MDKILMKYHKFMRDWYSNPESRYTYKPFKAIYHDMRLQRYENKLEG